MASVNSPEVLESPFDGKAMIPIKVKGVTVDLCQASGYVWFDKGEFEQLALASNRTKSPIHEDNYSKTESALDAINFVSWDLSIVGDMFDAIGDGIGKIGDCISFDP